MSKTNYIDEKGNYINVENLSLAEIYYKGVEAGRKAAEQAMREKAEADAEALREMFKLDDNEDTLKYKGGLY